MLSWHSSTSKYNSILAAKTHKNAIHKQYRPTTSHYHPLSTSVGLNCPSPTQDRLAKRLHISWYKVILSLALKDLMAPSQWVKYPVHVILFDALVSCFRTSNLESIVNINFHTFNLQRSFVSMFLKVCPRLFGWNEGPGFFWSTNPPKSASLHEPNQSFQKSLRRGFSWRTCIVML